MALAQIAKQFDKCMKPHPFDVDCGDCPLLKEVTLKIGSDGDEHGYIVWKLQGCSLMDLLDKSIDSKPQPELLNITQAGEMLNMHVNTLRRYADKGLIKSYRIGTRGDRRFSPAELQRFLEGRK